MKHITYKQYMKYRINNAYIGLEEKSEEYKLNIEKQYNDEQTKEIDKKHDKMFRKVLGRKKEMVKLLKQFLGETEEIEEEQLIQCSTDFITRKYESKQSDIIYKIKDKSIYFLIEHQSTVDKNMKLRLFDYMGEILRNDMLQYSKNRKINNPIIVPIVIYTGYRKWNTKMTCLCENRKMERYKKFKLEYNLIDAQNYKFEELLEKKSLFGSIMIIEKCKTKEELIEQMNKIIETIEDTEDKEVLLGIIDNIIRPIIGNEKTNQMLKNIKTEEMVSMSPLTKLSLDLLMEGEQKGRREGEKIGRIAGERRGKEKIIEIVKNMLKLGETEEKIEKYIGISKKEIKEIKEMV